MISAHHERLRVFARDNFWSLLSSVSVAAQGLIIVPIVVKQLGAGVFGAYALINSIVGLVVGLSSFGVGYQASRFLPSARTQEERRALYVPQFSFQCLSIVVLAGGFYLLAPLANAHLAGDGVPIARWMIPSLLILQVLYAQSNSYFRFTGRTRISILQATIYPYLFLALIVATIWVSRVDLGRLVVMQALTAVVLAVPLGIAITREIGWRPYLPSWSGLAADMALGLPVTGAYFVDVILSVGDRYVIGAFLGLPHVGAYAAAYAIGSVIVFVPKATGVVLPQLIAAAVDSGDQRGAERLLSIALLAFAAVGLPFVVGSAILGGELLALIGDAEIAARARNVVPIVALGNVFYGFNLLLTFSFYVQQRTRLPFVINMLAAAANLALNLIFVAWTGTVLASAIVTLICYLGAFVALRHAQRGTWRTEWHVPALLKIAGAAVAMGVALLAVAGIPVVLRIIVGVAAYVVMVLMLKPLPFDEWPLRAGSPA